MSEPKDVLAQLLTPEQAELLDETGRSAWREAAAAIGAALGAAPAISGVDARLVMPEEIAGEFEARHLVQPFQAANDAEQSATGYAVAVTAELAAFLGSAADDTSDQEQQTIVVGSTVLGQVVQALNSRLLAGSPTGLTLTLDDITADTMPGLLAAMDEPAIAVQATVGAGMELPLWLVLPGSFLELLAAGVLAQVESAAEPEPVAAPLERERTQAVEEREPVGVGAGAGSASSTREPTPITAAPAAHRARFAPLPETQPAPGRSAIDLIAGLQMSVCVELGRTDLTVSEVLGLGPGSVIELDRLAGEPVDILVNDRLIARGEVVVVDENFGVRVVEVVRRGGESEERAG